MKFIKIIITLFFIFSCNKKGDSKYKFEKVSYTVLDSVEYKEILIYKNIICSDLYYRSLKKNNDKVNLEDLSRAYYGPFSEDFKFLMEYDKNRELLINKWVNLDYNRFKEVEGISTKYPNGSLELIKIIEFLNSKDLKKHLDSISSVLKNR
jgi:hypothetical protein